MASVSLSKKWLRPSLLVFSSTEPTQQTWNISSISSTDTGTKVQYTTTATHDFIVGDQVTISGATNAGYNFTTPKTITNVTSNTFKVASTATGSSSTAVSLGSKWNFNGATPLYLTDDGRDPLQITPQRLEFKRRMLDGTMRSHYVTDKNQFSTSWKDLPSKKLNGSESITSDGFGAGQDLKDWYENTPGDFWMLAVYDGVTSNSFGIGSSVEKYHVFFDSFNYTISTRGQYNDLWDVSITLVEA